MYWFWIFAIFFSANSTWTNELWCHPDTRCEPSKSLIYFIFFAVICHIIIIHKEKPNYPNYFHSIKSIQIVTLFFFPSHHSLRAVTKKRSIAAVIAIVLIAGIVSTYCLVISKENAGELRVVGHGAVAANGQECADIGVSILKRGGSAADAAISVLLCEGITCESKLILFVLEL